MIWKALTLIDAESWIFLVAGAIGMAVLYVLGEWLLSHFKKFVVISLLIIVLAELVRAWK